MKKHAIILICLFVLTGCGNVRDEEGTGQESRKHAVRELTEQMVSTDAVEADMPADDEDYGATYEYYLTKEELIEDIEEGYIFRLNTAFKNKTPYVTGGNWRFYVHEDNTVNLEISFSNLIAELRKNMFPEDEQIIVEVISLDGESAYHFEKRGEEIMEDTSIQEQIPVTAGEWELRISFVYICGETPAHLKIAAAYESPSKEDIEWLMEERL